VKVSNHYSLSSNEQGVDDGQDTNESAYFSHVDFCKQLVTFALLKFYQLLFHRQIQHFDNFKLMTENPNSQRRFWLNGPYF
jgi:hypothetical protein